MRIAIIGGGVSGMLVAYLLSEDHEITLFEAEGYLGGHPHSLRVPVDREVVELDSGLMVYNHRGFPEFSNMLERVDLRSNPCPTGIGIRHDGSRAAYATTSMKAMGSERGAYLRPEFHARIADIARFEREARRFLEGRDRSTTIKEFAADRNFGPAVSGHYLPALLAAVWSADPADPSDCPAWHVMHFLDRHGLLDWRDPPGWRFVRGGVGKCVERLTRPCRRNIRLNTRIESVRRYEDHIKVIPQDANAERFDQVIIATPADRALAMIEDPTDQEQQILGSFPYCRSGAVLHCDDGVLAAKERARAVWNCRVPAKPRAQAALTYDLGRMQQVETPQPILLTFRHFDGIDPKKACKRLFFRHPIITWRSLAVQRRFKEISGERNTHYCGAYWGSGLAEDAVATALAVCRRFGKILK